MSVKVHVLSTIAMVVQMAVPEVWSPIGGAMVVRMFVRLVAVAMMMATPAALLATAFEERRPGDP